MLSKSCFVTRLDARDSLNGFVSRTQYACVINFQHSLIISVFLIVIKYIRRIYVRKNGKL